MSSPIGSVPVNQLTAVSDTTVAGVPTMGSASNAGAQYPLGFKTRYGATTQDRRIALVNSDGTLATDQDGAVPSGGASVLQKASSGELEFTFVKNSSGSTIQRGAVCSRDISEGPWAVESSGATNPANVIGVALFDIPTAKAGWVCSKGAVKTAVAASIGAAGTVVKPGASARVAAVAAATDHAIGVLIEDGASASAGDLLYVLLA